MVMCGHVGDGLLAVAKFVAGVGTQAKPPASRSPTQLLGFNTVKLECVTKKPTVSFTLRVRQFLVLLVTEVPFLLGAHMEGIF